MTRVLLVGGSPAPLFSALGNVGAALTLNLQDNLRSVITFTLSAPTCVISVTGAVQGAVAELYAYQDATGGRLITHPAAVTWTGAGAPILSGSPNAVDRLQYTVLAVSAGTVPTQIVGVGSSAALAPSPPGPVTPPVIT